MKQPQASWDAILFNKGKIKVLFKLRGCAGWSANILFAYNKIRFLRDKAHIPYTWFDLILPKYLKAKIDFVPPSRFISTWMRFELLYYKTKQMMADQTRQMQRLIRVFTGIISHFVGFFMQQLGVSWQSMVTVWLLIIIDFMPKAKAILDKGKGCMGENCQDYSWIMLTSTKGVVVVTFLWKQC